MDYVMINDTILSSIADSIRSARSISGQIDPVAFPSQINSIITLDDFINTYAKTSSYTDLSYLSLFSKIGPFGLNVVFNTRARIEAYDPEGGYYTYEDYQYGSYYVDDNTFNYRSAIVSHITELNPDSFNLMEEYYDYEGLLSKSAITQVYDIYPYTLPNLTKITDRIDLLLFKYNNDGYYEESNIINPGLCPYNSSISIPNCSYIGKEAFARCSNLTNECVQDILNTYKSYSTVIQQGAFIGCTNLSSLDLTGYTHIGSYAFAECTYLVDDYTISGLSSINMPSATYIGSYAFYTSEFYNNGLNIPISFNKSIISYIGDCAFKYSFADAYYSIGSLVFPNLTYIGAEVFASCSNVTYIDMPNCSYIGNSAFTYCNDLYYTSIPNVTHIGSYAFDATGGGSGPYEFNINLNKISYIGDNGLRFGYIDNYNQLSEILLPNCSYIGANVFYDYTNLSFISIPNCSYIGSHAFYNCINMSYISPMPNCSFIGVSAFYGCTSLYSIELHNCRHIEEDAFRNCFNLSSISIPNCSYIGSGAFYNCSSLTNSCIQEILNNYKHNPNNNRTITGYAFYGCSGITGLDLTGYDYLEWGAFDNCVNLSSINMPDCSYIGYSAFQSCTSLISISLPNCTELGGSVFEGCSNLPYIDMPECKNLYDMVFGNCTNLSYALLPKCKTIARHAFANCTNLSYVDASNCTMVASSAFYSCYNLSSINVPNCRAIGSCAFYECSKLQSISLPCCSSIDASAFYKCSKLESIYILSTTVPSLSNYNAFTNTPISNSTYLGYFGSIYVLSTLVNSFKTATNWKVYSSRIVAYTP